MEYFCRDKAIYLRQTDFNLDETLDCGQAFRWERVSDGYSGFFVNTPLTITKERDYFILHHTSEADFLRLWVPYFDLETDYGELKRLLSEEETLSKACAYAGGLRLLRQDGWEALCSFILSQNNNIPRIKGIIARLCKVCGGFPAARKLAEMTPEDLHEVRAGFRTKYILDAAKKISLGEVDIEGLTEKPLDTARRELQTILGVGPKVAECALLYGMYRVEAFPIDVWIKRVMELYYPKGLPEVFRPIAGIAQQYLFHYIRNQKC